MSAPGIARMQVWYAGGAVQRGRSIERLYNGHSEWPVCPRGIWSADLIRMFQTVIRKEVRTNPMHRMYDPAHVDVIHR